MSNLKETFTKEVIESIRCKQEDITVDLLDALRKEGNEGKEIALKILDMSKDHEQYYIDSFGNRASFDGNRRLKKSYVQFPLSKIHEEEIKRCAEDIHYFKDNYVKIKTKSGVNFPELRRYQDEYITELCKDENEDIIGLMGRQSGKSVSTGIYLAHLYNFRKDLNMGIVANRGSTAKEILNTVKNIIISLPIWMQQGTEMWNKGSIENESNMRILTDVPTADAFTGYTMSVLVVDECAKIGKTVWDEFADSIFPSQSGLAWKKNIIISTAYGMNHYYDMVKGARNGTNGMKIYEVDWKDVPRYDSDGTIMSNDKFMKKVIDKYGIIYFNQNYANEFLGSSHTLITTQKLQEMEHGDIQEIRDNKLKIYEYPIKGHKYIMSVDPAKDGTDAFAVQIIDTDDLKFRQVAAARLQIDYLLMPEFIHEWAEFYHRPFLIIENNEGAGQSIADQLFRDYEYENIYFDKDVGRNRKKKYPGFRTTPKSRKQILQTMKLFIENDRLKVQDKDTINEFFRFILKNNKYQADDGAHDDMIMSLALSFVPFCNTKNFDDMKEIVSNIYSSSDEDSNEERESFDFGDALIGASFDSGTDEEYESMKDQKKYYESLEEAFEDMEGFI